MRELLANWQKNLAQGFSSAAELLAFLNLPVSTDNLAAEKLFKTRVPLGFAKRMQSGKLDDPLLMQVLSTAEELHVTPDYSQDPLGEEKFNVIPGLIHKYKARVLLTVTGACAVNCRYCFRRHFAYQQNNPQKAGWDKALEYIASDSSIKEIILSGGDPLLAKDKQLLILFEHLRQIPHITTLRIHSRIPVVLPERIDDALLSILKDLPWKKVIVLHCNHAQELDESVALACNRLRAVDCHLLNQSVVLKGVNNNAQTLEQLSWRLFEFGVMPYYLHVMDKVQGGAHFDLPEVDVLNIYKELQTLLPGYLVPKLAREEVGKQHKTLLHAT
jgi:L-lysine 2,3-aminomutase